MFNWVDSLIRKALSKSKSNNFFVKIAKWLWGVKDKPKSKKESKQQEQIEPKPKKTRNQLTTIQQLAKRWDAMGEKQQDLTIDEIFRQISKDGTMNKDFIALRNKMYRILIKENLGRKALTPNEEITLKLFKKFFLKNQNNEVTQWTKIHSSWLVSGKYSFKQKTFKVKMVKGGGKIYTFYGVPENKFLIICLAPANAGKKWWNRYVNMWQYSRGKYGPMGRALALKVKEQRSKK